MISSFFGSLSCPLEVGNLFYIYCTSRKNAEILNINLCNGQTCSSDIPLHLSLRFKDQVVVANSLKNGNWGVEETHQLPDELVPGTKVTHPVGFFKNYLFFIGKGIVIYFIILEDLIRININKLKFDFAHRYSFKDIRCVTVTKDVAYVQAFNHYQTNKLVKFSEQYWFSNEVPKPFSPGHMIRVTAIPSGKDEGRFAVFFPGQSSTRISNQRPF